MKIPVIVIMGFTASGKSKLAIDLAKRFDGEIISADSVAVYRGMDIGSAKPSASELLSVPHHLVDCLDIDQGYDVSQFVTMAKQLIGDIFAKGKIPIIVGGTGLYIRALLYDYHFVDETSVVDDYDDYTNQQLWELLNKLDSIRADKIHVNNRVRLLRAVRALCQGGRTYDEIFSLQSLEPVYDTKLYFLSADRNYIYDRINQRVDLMMENGLLAEVSRLSKNGQLFGVYRSLNAIGYKEFKLYFEQQKSLNEVVELIKKNSRHFAKRQLTWFKNQMSGTIVDISELNVIEREIEQWLKR